MKHSLDRFKRAHSRIMLHNASKMRRPPFPIFHHWSFIGHLADESGDGNASTYFSWEKVLRWNCFGESCRSSRLKRSVAGWMVGKGGGSRDRIRPDRGQPEILLGAMYKCNDGGKMRSKLEFKVNGVDGTRAPWWQSGWWWWWWWNRWDTTWDLMPIAWERVAPSYK